MSPRNFFKFHKLGLPISVFVVSILLYFHLKGFESWSDIPWRDIRFLTEFILIVLVIPALAYVFGVYYYTCAVITVRPECFQDEAQKLEGKALKDKKLYVHSDGKVYSIKKEFLQLKIYFSRKGKHSVYLYDEKGNLYGPQEANTYEHNIAYVEFKKKNNKSESKDAGKESGQSDAPSIICNSSKQDNEKT